MNTYQLLRTTLFSAIVGGISTVGMAADSTTNSYTVTDGNADDFTFYSLQNASHPSAGMCHDDGKLEWFTNGLCAGTGQEMSLTSSGRLALGVDLPEASLHIKESDPSIILETSDGTPTWELDGLGDFKLRLDNEIIVTVEDTDGASFCRGCVGIGEANPASPLHITRTDETQEFLFLESNEGGGAQDRAMMFLTNNGGIRFEFANPALGTAWRFQAATGNEDVFEIAKVGTGKIELLLDANGNLSLAGSLLQVSDRNSKQDVIAVEGAEVLDRINQVPVAEWAYIDDPDTRHFGPMAQDFHAAFGLGKDDRHISPLDLAGVNLAAIKAQQEKISALEARNQDLEGQLAELRLLMNSTLAAVEAAGIHTASKTAAR